MSGDSGAAGCDFSVVGPQASKGRVAGFPASLPEVTAIGGTTFNEGTGNYWAAKNNPTDSSSALSYIPEVAWNDSSVRSELAATGGGVSIFYSKPWWQAGKGVPQIESGPFMLQKHDDLRRFGIGHQDVD